ELVTRLVDEVPGEARYRSLLATAEMNLGVNYSRKGRRVEAEAQYRRALELYRRLADSDPADPEHQAPLALRYSTLGTISRPNSRSAGAVEEFRQAVAIQEKVAADHPDRPGYRSRLTLMLNNLSESLIFLKQYDEAERTQRRCREVAEKLA